MLELRQANSTYAWLRKIGCPNFICTSYLLLGNRWLNSSDGEWVSMGLVAVNAVIFLAWQIRLPAVRLFMYEHVTHHPLSGRTYTVLRAKSKALCQGPATLLGAALMKEDS